MIGGIATGKKNFLLASFGRSFLTLAKTVSVGLLINSYVVLLSSFEGS